MSAQKPTGMEISRLCSARKNSKYRGFTRCHSGYMDPRKLQGGWKTFYNLGVEMNQQMVPFRSWEQVGKALGVSKQNAYTEGVLALGKLAHAIYRATKIS